MDDDESHATEGITRRTIYLQRLVGDNILKTGNKVKRQREATWRILLFIGYVVLGAYVITENNKVLVQQKINNAVELSLKSKPFNSKDPAKYFDDIYSVRDAIDWIQYAFLPQLFTGGWRSNDFSLLTFNRILGLYEGHASSIRITQRRVKQNFSGNKRFEDDYYPRIWSAFGIDAYSRADSRQDSAPIKATYMDSKRNPGKWDWKTVEWKESPSAFNANRGYLAVIELKKNEKAQKIMDDFKGEIDWVKIATEILPDLSVTLVESEINTKAGIRPPPPKATNVTTFDHFISSYTNPNLFGEETAVLAIEFMVYNANYQTISLVEVVFEWNCAGILTKRDIEVSTIELYSEANQRDEFAIMTYVFIIMTVGYAVIQLRSLQRLRRAFFFDSWNYCDVLSTAVILASCAVDWQIQAKKTDMAGFKDFPDIEYIREHIAYVRTYRYLSALGLWTAFLRIIKFMSSTISRVELLIKTLEFATPMMLWYLIFISLFLIGFVFVSHINFGALSPEFVGVYPSLVSCFTLFMGDVSPMDRVDDSPLSNVFFIPFVLFFFFISVQMFNAIINYSYNKASEEMEPIFDQERRYKAYLHKIKAKKREKRKPILAWLCGNPGRASKSKKGSSSSLSSTAERAKTAVTRTTGGKFDYNTVQDQAVKERIRGMLEAEEVKPADSSWSIIVFSTFAICYFLFLFLNLQVTENFVLKSSIGEAMRRASYPFVQADNRTTAFFLTYDSIVSLDDLNTWLREAPKRAIFPQYKPGSASSTTMSACINGWNCLIKGPTTMLRHTQRQLKMVTNSNKKIPRQGKHVISSRRPLKYFDAYEARGSPWEIDGRSGNDAIYETKSTGSNKNRKVQFCHYTTQEGFQNKGGIECLMSYDPEIYEAQSQLLFKSQPFVSTTTASHVLELIAFNGNVEMVVYCSWIFNINAAGMVEKHMQHNAFLLQTYEPNHERLTLIPLGIYGLILCYYIIAKFLEIRVEYVRNLATEKKHLIMVAGEHFWKDFFNTMDLISICLSTASIPLFINYVIVWLLKFDNEQEKLRDINASTELDGYSQFLNYISGMTRVNLFYVRLSSFNILVIFFRFLKLFRDSPRMNKLNQTLWAAKTDILWFVIMLFIAMFAFIFFAHIVFGPSLEQLSVLFPDAFIFCFTFILGTFDYQLLSDADPIFGPIFFFLYLILYCVVFLNIFFAIIDRFFVTATPPPMNIKGKLKPYFRHCLPFIQWDDDIYMEEDPQAPPKEMPPSRRKMTSDTKRAIDQLRQNASRVRNADEVKKSVTILEACDADDQLIECHTWATEEARKLVDKIQRLEIEKGEVTVSEFKFVNTKVEDELSKELRFATGRLDDAYKSVAENISGEKFHERGQVILSKYILLLEHKIHVSMHARFQLQDACGHLQREIKAIEEQEEIIANPLHGFRMTANRQDSKALADDESSSSERDAGTTLPPTLFKARSSVKINPDAEMGRASEASHMRRAKARNTLSSRLASSMLGPKDRSARRAAKPDDAS